MKYEILVNFIYPFICKVFCATVCKAQYLFSVNIHFLGRFRSHLKFTIIFCEIKHIFSTENYLSYETVLDVHGPLPESIAPAI